MYVSSETYLLVGQNEFNFSQVRPPMLFNWLEYGRTRKQIKRRKLSLKRESKDVFWIFSGLKSQSILTSQMWIYHNFLTLHPNSQLTLEKLYPKIKELVYSNANRHMEKRIKKGYIDIFRWTIDHQIKISIC